MLISSETTEIFEFRIIEKAFSGSELNRLVSIIEASRVERLPN